jgi:beta-phosphoglucomutase-like phosphatase (HAD superfamily)
VGPIRRGVTVGFVDWNQFDAALFDLDGVLTPSADLHMRAWFLMFSTYFVERDVAPAYTDADYFSYIDGKPRYDGDGRCLPHGGSSSRRATRRASRTLRL